MNKRAKTTPVRKQRIYMVRTMMVLIGIVLVFAIGEAVLYMNDQITPKNFTSEFMKIGFEYPSKYTLKSELTSIILSNNTSYGRISISTYGTNFIDVNSHVENSIGRWKDRPTSKESFAGIFEKGLVISGESKGEPYRIYYFVKNYMIYQLEANDPALFSDLDSIAKSFRILQ